ncbi:hypothetical protein TNCV_1319311 [Trichonephila clavipes]|nr:hypothetical protein TNCV_1319311 [Trichonephila clavipes]
MDGGQRYFLLFGLEKACKFFHRFRTVVAPLNSATQLIPEVFHRIQVWTLSRPVQLVHFVIILPVHGGPHNMTIGVVLLEVTMRERERSNP